MGGIISPPPTLQQFLDNTLQISVDQFVQILLFSPISRFLEFIFLIYFIKWIFSLFLGNTYFTLYPSQKSKLKTKSKPKPKLKKKGILDMTFQEFYNERHPQLRVYGSLSTLVYLKSREKEIYNTLRKEALSKRFNRTIPPLKKYYRSKIDKVIDFDFLETIEDTKKVQNLTKQIQKIQTKYEKKHLSLYKN